MSQTVRAIVCAIILMTGAAVHAPAQSWEHSKWLDQPIDRLMEMAGKDIADGGRKDTALMCYTIVANRYEASLSREQQVMCKDANMRLWSIYFYDFYDYPKCFDCLTRALEIATDAGIEDANIYLGFGCMYQTISEECKDYELGTTAFKYYQKALETGLKTHDDEHTDMACTDVLSMAYAQGGLDHGANAADGYVDGLLLAARLGVGQVEIMVDHPIGIGAAGDGQRGGQVLEAGIGAGELGGRGACAAGFGVDDGELDLDLRLRGNDTAAAALLFACGVKINTHFLLSFLFLLI